jgi:hypothetical protein
MNKSRFAHHVAKESKRTILGKLVRFIKGDWVEGPDKDLIPPGEGFVAIMDTSTIGFVKWGGGEIIDAKMGLVANGFCMPHRNELGDLDSEDWPVDKNGDRVDPWQATSLLVFASLGSPHDLYTFSTSSVGGRGAILDLEEIHSQTTEGAGEYPVVLLETDFYKHKDSTIGRVYVPVFKVVGAVDAGPFNAMIARTRGGAAFLPTSVRAPIAITGGDPAGDGAPAYDEVPEGDRGVDPGDALGGDVPY